LLFGLYRFRVRQVARHFQVRTEERINERIRVARDLHDTLLQSFQGVLLQFHAATFLLPDRPTDAKSALAGCIEQAREAIAEGRDAIQGLRSPEMLTNDLPQAVGALAEELAHRQDSPVFRLQVEGAPRSLVPLLGDEVYRVAGESVRNAFKHA